MSEHSQILELRHEVATLRHMIEVLAEALNHETELRIDYPKAIAKAAAARRGKP